MEQLSQKDIGRKDIRNLFDVNTEATEKQYSHSVYNESLSFNKKHTFPAYEKEKTIDQFVFF